MLCGSPFYSTRHNLLALPSPQPEPAKAIEGVVIEDPPTTTALITSAEGADGGQINAGVVGAPAVPADGSAPTEAVPPVSKRLDVDDVALMQQVGFASIFFRVHSCCRT